MRNTIRSVILAFFSLVCQGSHGQTKSTFLLKDIGWTINLPNDFKIEDSAFVIKQTNEGKVILENSSHLKLNTGLTKTLISASKDMFNQFNVTLSKSGASTEHFWDSVNNNMLKLFYNAMVKQAPADAQIDSSRTIETIDGVRFKSFTMIFRLTNGLTVYNYIISRLYQGSTLSINYNYTDKSAGEELHKMLKESKFVK